MGQLFLQKKLDSLYKENMALHALIQTLLFEINSSKLSNSVNDYTVLEHTQKLEDNYKNLIKKVNK